MGSKKSSSNSCAKGVHGHADGNGPSAQFESIQNLAVDEEGNIWLADSGNRVLRKITPEGDVTTLTHKTTDLAVTIGPLSDAVFLAPMTIAFDPVGRAYVFDYYGGIKKIE